jgi:hypothetical protein
MVKHHERVIPSDCKDPIATDKKIRYRFAGQYRGYSVSNAPSVGGSSLVKAANLFFEEEVDGFDAGETLKNIKRQEEGDDSHAPRTKEEDTKLDEKVREIFRRRRFGINAKLGAVIALEEGHEDIVRVLATCNRDIAARRAVKRRAREIKRQIRQLEEEHDSRLISDEVYRVKKKTILDDKARNNERDKKSDIRDRVKKDLAQWGEITPEIAGVNIFDENAEVTFNGRTNDLYHFKVSTGGRGGVAVAVRNLFDGLLGIKAVKKVRFFGERKKEADANLPTEIIIFEEATIKSKKPVQQKLDQPS